MIGDGGLVISEIVFRSPPIVVGGCIVWIYIQGLVVVTLPP